eukprot:Selendium_serpulae@DN4841_c0_g1_i7.p1
MGIGVDGATTGLKGSVTGERMGLGAIDFDEEKQNKKDVFEDYRRQRANNYHKSIAKAQADRMTPGFEDSLRVCCICSKPGHFAKECKFGIP